MRSISCNREQVAELYQKHKFEIVIHCAAQPSHDKAKEIPYLDFDVNAGGTMNMLEATRRYAPAAVFLSYEHQQSLWRCAQ